MALKACLTCGRLSNGSRCRLCKRKSPYQQSRWRMLAREVVADAGGRCSECGASGPDAYVSAHHVIDRVEGGPDHPSNLIALCARCHGSEPR